jgi:hypothetical protein
VEEEKAVPGVVGQAGITTFTLFFLVLVPLSVMVSRQKLGLGGTIGIHLEKIY